MKSELDQLTVFALAATTDNTVCFAATDAGLWRWRAGTWQPIAAQFAAVSLSSVAAYGNSIWVGASGDIAVSHDAGESWVLSRLPIKAAILALAVSPDFARDGLVLAATAHDGVLRSADGGASFHAWNFGLLDLNINALALSPRFADDGLVVAASDHAVFASRNGGRAWHELLLPAETGPFTTLAFDAQGGLWAGSEGNGLWHAATIETAFERAVNFKPQEVNAVLGDIAATSAGVYRRSAQRWKKISSEERVLCMVECGGRLFLGGVEMGVLICTAD